MPFFVFKVFQWTFVNEYLFRNADLGPGLDESGSRCGTENRIADPD
jgi:hypothetical protein